MASEILNAGSCYVTINTFGMNPAIEDRKIIPLKLRITEELTDLCQQIDIVLPSNIEYRIPDTILSEISVFFDDEYFTGGVYQSARRDTNTSAYKFISYGYQIARTPAVASLQYNGEKIGQYVLNLLLNNIKYRSQTLYQQSVDGYFSSFKADVPIPFILYTEDFSIFNETVEQENKEKPQADKTEKILSYLGRFLKSKNIFLKSRGLRKNFNTNQGFELTPKGNLDYDNAIVIELFKPFTEINYTGGLVNAYDSNYNNIYKDFTVNTSLAKKKQYYYGTSDGKILDASTNLANFNWIEDKVINDGTYDFIEFDRIINTKYLYDLLQYEVNKDNAKAYNITGSVIGFRQGITAEGMLKGIDLNKFNFWKTNQTATYKAVDGSVKSSWLIDRTVHNFDDNGAYTVLRIVPPKSYSIFESYDLIEEEQKEIIETIKKEKKKKNLLSSLDFEERVFRSETGLI